jgi:hypothetical protein
MIGRKFSFALAFGYDVSTLHPRVADGTVHYCHADRAYDTSTMRFSYANSIAGRMASKVHHWRNIRREP